MMNKINSYLRSWGLPIIHPILDPMFKRWPSFSHLFLISDSSKWVISWEMKELAKISRKLGIRISGSRWISFATNQSVFYGNHFFLLTDAWMKNSHRIATAYFHGRPGSGISEFDTVYNNLCNNHQYIARIQVSHTEMLDITKSSGIDKNKVFLIPIGINLSYFSKQTSVLKKIARKRFKIPNTAVVVGSFQKDGIGWGDGNEPKLIKGPDILIKTVKILKDRISELFILLAGPSRGFVKKGLDTLGIPYLDVGWVPYPMIGTLYHALDAYLVTSRQEGGPQSVLEAMASGIPLITTRVGQAMDLIKHCENGWIVDVEDSEGLAFWTEQVLLDSAGLEKILSAAHKTAETNSYESQIPLWRDFFNGFVEG